MIRTAGTLFAVVAIGTVAIAWTQTHKQAPQPAPLAETINPDSFGRGGLPEQKVDDMSFVDMK